jgi:hypothetical protein
MTRAAGAYPNAGGRSGHVLLLSEFCDYFFFSGFFGPSTGGSDLM